MNNGMLRDVPRTLALALVLWSGAVVLGTYAGVFARLDGGVFGALVAFTAAFACAVMLVDHRVGGWLAARAGTTAAVAIAGAIASLLATGAAMHGAIEPAGALGAPVLLLVVPVTLATAIAAVRATRWAGRARSGCVAPATGT